MKTQCERIIKYMEDFGGITTLDRRIHDLRKQGYKIGDKYVSNNNRYGEKVSYKRYFLQ